MAEWAHALLEFVSRYIEQLFDVWSFRFGRTRDEIPYVMIVAIPDPHTGALRTFSVSNRPPHAVRGMLELHAKVCTAAPAAGDPPPGHDWVITDRTHGLSTDWRCAKCGDAITTERTCPS